MNMSTGVMMKKKRLFWNTIIPVVQQAVTIVCGFIVPRLLLSNFGSEVNGLVASITQFLSVIAFMEMGIGAVVQTTLYKPLAENDFTQISKIVHSADRFFRKIAIALIVYTVLLIGFFPLIVETSFDPFYTGTLIFVISISSFAQYYFGITNQLLLNSDQKIYIPQLVTILAVITNTIICAILIRSGATIQIVKLSTSFIYLMRPFVLWLYVKKKYKIDRKIELDGEPIKQKWNGVAQHIAAIILDGTDNIVLTLFSTLSNVSIYSVYHLVIAGVKQLVLASTGGIQALLGELWAKQEEKKLEELFGWVEWGTHSVTVLIFGCTGVLILPFVAVYTRGITDANYIVPVFSVLLVCAHAFHCLRLPYNLMVLAAGHYRETQNSAIIQAAMNIVISIIAVWRWGLVGVAIGTLAAMIYRTVYLAKYLSDYIIKWPFVFFIKQLAVDTVIVLCAVTATSWFRIGGLNYMAWFFLAIKTVIVWTAVAVTINLIFYRDRVVCLTDVLKRHFRPYKIK